MDADPLSCSSAPLVVLVAGTHRSGTSVTTGILHRLGFAIGEPVMPPHPDNPTGYFENLRVVGLHEELFAEVGATWSDIVDVWSSLDDERRTHWTARAATLLGELMDGADRFVLKDPRLVRVLPMWSSALASMEADGCYVMTVRDPSEVAASLHRRDGLAAAHAEAMWNLDVDLMLRHFAGRRHAVVGYARLLEAPHATVQVMLDDIGVASDPAELDAAVRLVTPELNRSRSQAEDSTGVPAADVSPATTQRYRDLVASGRVGPS